jgi:putative ABC transport system permease protein
MQNQALQKEFKILELDSFYIKERIQGYLFRHLYIVVDSINEINEIVGSTEESHVISFDVTEEVDTEFFYSLDDTLKSKGTIFYEIKKIVSDEWIMYFGGGLILLIFMSLLFMMTFILTLYFKQISEGYEDAKRYDIYRKLGVSEKIIKKSTNKQMLRIFSIPLLGALLHGIFSLFLIRRILLAFRMSNFMIILNSFLVIAFIFAVVYYISYKLTSRVYYRIIS